MGDELDSNAVDFLKYIEICSRCGIIYDIRKCISYRTCRSDGKVVDTVKCPLCKEETYCVEED